MRRSDTLLWLGLGAAVVLMAAAPEPRLDPTRPLVRELYAIGATAPNPEARYNVYGVIDGVGEKLLGSLQLSAPGAAQVYYLDALGPPSANVAANAKKLGLLIMPAPDDVAKTMVGMAVASGYSVA